MVSIFAYRLDMLLLQIPEKSTKIFDDNDESFYSVKKNTDIPEWI